MACFIFDVQLFKMRLYFIIFFFGILSLSAQAINSPIPNSPANGFTFSSFNVFVSVNSIAAAKGYQYQFDTVPNFSSPWMKIETYSLNGLYSPELKLGKTYYWRARAFDLNDTSVWSGSQTFNPINGALGQNSPANNSTGPITNLICSSEGSNISVGYIFEMDTIGSLNSFNKLVRVHSGNSWNDSILFSFGRTIFWRARAFNSFGDTLAWSSIWKYTFHQMPALNASTITQLVNPMMFPNWSNAGLSTIQLQADTSIGFNTSKLIEHFLAPGVIMDTLKNLYFGKDYYYRIRAIYKGKFSSWSFIAPIRVFTNGNVVSPSNGSTIGLLTPGYNWQSLTGTRSTFQLFEDSARTIKLQDTILNGFTHNRRIELKLNKWYNYRVKYFHDLDTTNWIQANFKTYTGQVNLGPPNLNSTSTTVRPRFNFRKQTWATGHVMEIDTGIAFGSTPSSYFIRVDSFLYDGSFYHFLDTTIAYNQNYVWRVYAIKDLDTAQATESKFKVTQIPVNFSPQNNFIGTGPTTSGLVIGISGSQYIQWELDTTLSFSSPIKFSGTKLHIRDPDNPQYVKVDFPIDLLFKTKYFWRSRCLNLVDTSNWSVPFNFITTQDVWLTSPLNNDTNVSIKPILAWGIQGSVSELRFQYQISTDSLLDGTTIFTLPPNSSSNVSVNLMYGKQYYWRARAYHTKDTSAWSAIYRFKTIAPPTISGPVLVSPANGQKNVPVATITLTWNFLTNATSYDIEVSKDQSFSTIVSSGNTSNTAILFSGVQAKTRYYWRVRGRVNEVLGPWSSDRWFETAAPTGLEMEMDDKTSINVYPNPTNQVFELTFNGDYEIKITNLQGQLMFETKAKNILQVNAEKWEPGVYFINLCKENQCFIKKIVKQ
jgi:hypothetical protein